MPPVAVGASELETEYAYRVFEIMNRAREENGLEPLVITQKLMDTAQFGAQEISGFYSQTGRYA